MLAVDIFHVCKIFLTEYVMISSNLDRNIYHILVSIQIRSNTDIHTIVCELIRNKYFEFAFTYICFINYFGRRKYLCMHGV
jgi:hypothetical protein